MTRPEAEERARWLQEHDPARESHRFVTREVADGRFEVVRIEVPERLRTGPFVESVEAKPRFSPADDPRTGNERRLPGLPGGL